ncbi:DUF1365 domain-containing protein [Luteibacter aegosomatissinici]|uniref:DUF1365 domain-containing protein n=1 Tax=Luteibacter aegosomatissinici TaxID=2911539 RepID=UPI001FF8B681|nr:DUF1365 domain-containing protein [Luteibacter aegosomatissinici]UPG96309.1 DUF1365 domain-containing protein [Luteibacter aegosomatissinici]
MSESFTSAVYEGFVTHRRHAPHPHAFRYRMAQLWLDLDEVDDVFAGRWLWSARGRNLAEFRRSDYLGPVDVPLAEAVRDRVALALGSRPPGPVRLLAHLRYAGYVFNPVSFYYCYDTDGTTLLAVLAEITNTPWRERHAYVLPAPDDDMQMVDATFAKAFHVSPFMPMERTYRWRFNVPDDHLRVHMDVLRGDEHEFDAHLALERHPLNGASLARVLWRYPLMTAQVIGAIHFEALRLWLKRNPVHDHPGKQPRGIYERHRP